MPTPEPKRDLRRRVAEALRQSDAGERAGQSRQICERLHPLAPSGATVLAFWPLPSEPDIRPALERWLAQGITVCLPKVRGSQLVACAVADFDHLKPSAHGVLEPAPHHAGEVDAADLSLVVVPGLAFTREGERLGRGGGFYDRFLADLPDTVATVGVAFDFQLRGEIPTEPHDQRVGIVIAGRP